MANLTRKPPTPDRGDLPEVQLEEKIRYHLYATGERDRLKELLARKLEECGWKDEIKERAKGGSSCGPRVCRGEPLGCHANAGWGALGLQDRALNHQAWPPFLVKHTEYIHKRGRSNVTTDDIVRAVRPEGRALVPDSIKAELLSEIKRFILNL